jgi:hypothetical protein
VPERGCERAIAALRHRYRVFPVFIIVMAAMTKVMSALMVLASVMRVMWGQNVVPEREGKLEAGTLTNTKRFSACLLSMGFPDWLISIRCSLNNQEQRNRIRSKAMVFLRAWGKKGEGEFGWIIADGGGLRFNIAVFDLERRLGRKDIAGFASRYFDDASIESWDDAGPGAREIRAALRPDDANVIFGGRSCDLLFLRSFRIWVYGVGMNADSTGSGYSWWNETVGMKSIKRIDGLTRIHAMYLGLFGGLKPLPRNAKVEILSDSKAMVAEFNQDPTTIPDTGYRHLTNGLRKVILQRGLEPKFILVSRADNLARKFFKGDGVDGRH